MSKYDKYWLQRVRESRRGKKIHHAKRELARGLVGAGMTYRDVADTLEISVGSVHNLLKEPPAEVAPIVREMNARLAHKASMLADHVLARIDDLDIGKASLKEKAIAAAILMDKARMLAERPEPLIGSEKAHLRAETGFRNGGTTSYFLEQNLA